MTSFDHFIRLSLVASAVMLHVGARPAEPLAVDPAIVTLTTFATGLNNPRGLKFDDRGMLYVAEGGIGGNTSTQGRCEQVIPPVGPYLGSPTGGRISRIGPWGYRETVTDTLPSNLSAPAGGGEILGVGDVAFIGRRLLAVLAGAGCSHGVRDIPNGVVEVSERDGRWALRANLSAYQQAHPTAHENPADYEPDGVWYGMVAVGDALYAVEPNHGELDRIDLDGRVTRVADISATQGHVVPTAIVWHDGAFYVGELGVFPLVAGSAKVLRVTLSGDVTVHAEGFTAITGLAFDPEGDLYVLENTTGNPFPTPGTGDIVRIGGPRRGSDAPELPGTPPTRQVLASGLVLLTAMTYHEGSLYVSSGGFGLPLGQGSITRIRLNRVFLPWLGD